MAGDTAGGNLAAAVAIRARDQGALPLALQVLIYPVTNYGFDTASYHENANGYGLLCGDDLFLEKLFGHSTKATNLVLRRCELWTWPACHPR